MLCRKRPTPRRRRARKLIALTVAGILFCLTYFELAVKAQLRDIIIRDMQTLSERAVTLAVDDYLAENPDIGESLCRISFHDGSVAALSADTAAVNAVKTSVTKRAQAYIDELSHTQGISTRLGSFTGLVSLLNVGPEVRFTVDSTQTVSCEFESTFEGAGLNQTVHHITMTVYVDLLVYNPFRIRQTVSTSSTFEIAQTVVVGAVPSYGGVLSSY